MTPDTTKRAEANRIPLKVWQSGPNFYCALLGHHLFRSPHQKRTHQRQSFENFVFASSPKFDVIYVAPPSGDSNE